MENFFTDIKDISFKENVELKNYTTFQLGGVCPLVVACALPEQLQEILKKLSVNKEKFAVIGEGSNVLVSDEGLNCIVVQYLSQTPIVDRRLEELRVAASTRLDALVQFSCEKGLAGLENLSGIPGTVAGAIVGNAGAFGEQISDTLTNVTIFSDDDKIQSVKKEDLGFSYRNSHLKDSKDVVLSATFQLKKGDAKNLLAKRKDILAKRKTRHPDYRKTPCAGSFFRNIEKSDQSRQAAGEFLDKAGTRDMHVGGACVYPKHANIIIKKDPSCCAKDVYLLSKKMQHAVEEKFGIKLIREVRLVGNFEGRQEGENFFW